MTVRASETNETSFKQRKLFFNNESFVLTQTKLVFPNILAGREEASEGLYSICPSNFPSISHAYE